VLVIGVLDLLGGRAVHARGGRREHYAPVRAIGDVFLEPGDALALARGYVDQLAITDLYLADLDAIAGRTSQDSTIASLAHAGARLWIDAGVSSPDGARHVLGLGAVHVVVGLETLGSYESLNAICAAIGGERVIFSLDLRDGEPVVAGDRIHGEPPHVIAARAADAGVGRVIVLDLARVGAGVGFDMELIARIRKSVPEVTLFAGGGVRDIRDIESLAAAGCDGALVATALLNGAITADEVRAIIHVAGGSRTAPTT
jgi:phosphoribosylformimino-5-aminoimidazole carboxamide ribotide isomerase